MINIWNMVLIQVGSIWYVQSVNTSRLLKIQIITLTSKWPQWRLKSPASRLFTQSFIQTQIKENIKAPRHWPLCGEFTGTRKFPAQRASYAENVSIWWRHHVLEILDQSEHPNKMFGPHTFFLKPVVIMFTRLLLYFYSIFGTRIATRFSFWTAAVANNETW